MTMTIAYIIHDNSNIEIYTLTYAQRKNSRSEYNQRQHWQRHLQSRKPHPLQRSYMEAPAIFSPTPYNIKTLPTLHNRYIYKFISHKENNVMQSLQTKLETITSSMWRFFSLLATCCILCCILCRLCLQSEQ